MKTKILTNSLLRNIMLEEYTKQLRSYSDLSLTEISKLDEDSLSAKDDNDKKDGIQPKAKTPPIEATPGKPPKKELSVDDRLKHLEDQIGQVLKTLKEPNSNITNKKEPQKEKEPKEVTPTTGSKDSKPTPKPETKPVVSKEEPKKPVPVAPVSKPKEEPKEEKPKPAPKPEETKPAEKKKPEPPKPPSKPEPKAAAGKKEEPAPKKEDEEIEDGKRKHKKKKDYTATPKIKTVVKVPGEGNKLVIAPGTSIRNKKEREQWDVKNISLSHAELEKVINPHGDVEKKIVTNKDLEKKYEIT